MKVRTQAVDDDPDRAPTGEPYRRRRRRMQSTSTRTRSTASLLRNPKARTRVRGFSCASKGKYLLHSKNNESDDDDDDDNWFTDDDDDDENAVLESIRQARWEEVKRQQVKRAENMAKGHGQYRTISQDEFLPECTSYGFSSPTN